MAIRYYRNFRQIFFFLFLGINISLFAQNKCSIQLKELYCSHKLCYNNNDTIELRINDKRRAYNEAIQDKGYQLTTWEPISIDKFITIELFVKCNGRKISLGNKKIKCKSKNNESIKLRFEYNKALYILEYSYVDENNK